jgi:signal transduction histidine kinase
MGCDNRPRPMAELTPTLEGQMRAQERQLVGVRLVMAVLAAIGVLIFRDRLPGVPLLLGVVGVVVVYSVSVPLLLRRFPAREVGIVTTALDMAAVTVAVYVASEAIDAYLFYGLVVLTAALRFGLGASIWASVVVSFTYVSVILIATGPESTVRELLPVRIAYLIGFGVVAGFFSRVVIGRATENARLQQRLAEEERERARVREQELMSQLGRDFVASLDRAATVDAIVGGSAPLLGDATLLHLVDEDAPMLQPAAADGSDRDLAERLLACARDHPLRIGEGAAGSAAATATTVVVGPGTARQSDPECVAALALGWLMAIPIVSGGRVQGVLVTVGRQPSAAPTADQRRLAESIAERAGPALENATLWAGLQQRMEAVREAQRAKDDFLSIVSHELRTPLTSIQGYAQLLEGRLSAQAAPESKELSQLRVIRSQVGRMRRLVDDLLDVSRIDRRGGVSIEPSDFDLAELVREAAARIRREHPARRVTEQIPEAVPIRADRDRIDQVLANLVDNAVKYSPEGGPVHVELERRGPRVALSVADEGVGIPDEHFEHVFERFYQANGEISRRRFGGLGLGLYISSAIVHAHGGEIRAEPNETAGRGTVFVVTLPRRTPDPPIQAAVATGAPPPFVLRRGSREPQ